MNFILRHSAVYSRGLNKFGVIINRSLSLGARGVFNFELSREHSAAKPQKNFCFHVK